MRGMRKVTGILLALALSFSLTACQGTAPEESEGTMQESSGFEEMEDGTEESAQPSQDAAGSSAQPEESTAPSQEEGLEEPEYKIADFEIPDTEAFRFVRDMKIGWNLGNSFDAVDCTWLTDEMDYESAWCGARATPELIQTLKDAGFNTVRIPVSWHNHVKDKESYTISEAWLNRVNEVVDYCIDRDMYVIINIHHDNNEEFLYPTNQYLDQSVRYVTSIWTQLAERFRDYGEKLIFASMNEPRLVGHTNEWWIDPNSEDCKDAISCINTLNQAFVDTVRASGGNNAVRYLICPGYDASPDGALNDGFVFPTDLAENDHRIILSVHAYTPYTFALESPGTDTWSSKSAKDVAELTGFMNKIYQKYVVNGTPVIIDEFGAQEKNGNLESRVDFAGCYIAQARARGITCVWWDNNCVKGDGERFGIIDRRKRQWVFPEIVEAMMKYAP